jgi:hypothetical protein
MTTNSEHEKLRRLVLAWEELDEAERAAASAHLAECPSCRELLARFEQRECEPGPRGALPNDAPALDPADLARAEASRHALLERLGVGEPASVVPRPARPRRGWAPRVVRWAWLAPAAAAAAVIAVVWLASPRPDAREVVQELVAVRPGTVRGEGSPAAPRDGTWRTGEAFELRVRLARPGWPALVHVGPDGAVTLLRPAASDTTSVGAGVRRFGPADAGDAWLLEDPPGDEDLLLGLRTSGPVNRGALLRALEDAEAQAPRAARVDAVRRAIERHAGPVRQLTLRHR